MAERGAFREARGARRVLNIDGVVGVERRSTLGQVSIADRVSRGDQGGPVVRVEVDDIDKIGKPVLYLLNHLSICRHQVL